MQLTVVHLEVDSTVWLVVQIKMAHKEDPKTLFGQNRKMKKINFSQCNDVALAKDI